MLLLKLSQSPPVHKRKRQRTNPEQLDLLEQMFQTNTMPNQQTRVQLAAELGMSARRIQIWFQNKRAKVRRIKIKQDDILQQRQTVVGELSGSDFSKGPSVQSLSPSSLSSPSLTAAEDCLSPCGSPSSPVPRMAQLPPSQPLNIKGMEPQHFQAIVGSCTF